MKTKIKAPTWFVERMAKIDKLEDEMRKDVDANLGKECKDYLKECQEKVKKGELKGDIAGFLEFMKIDKSKLPPLDFQKKMILMDKMLTSMTRCAWDELRFEIYPSGLSFENLNYNDKKKEITINKKK